MQLYSQRLGKISNKQFQEALDVFDLGKFIKAEPISEGLFGQNVFITSSKGEFIFRGKPHYDWQFKSEQFFVNLLHKRTEVPVPYPYLLNEEIEIFGWEYIIMPRMKGKSINNLYEDKRLNENDQIQIVEAMGRMLKQAQKLTNKYCGKYDLELDNIKPYKPSWFESYSQEIIDLLVKSSQYESNTSKQDIIWAKRLIKSAKENIEEFKPTFSMQDFKLQNMVFDKPGGSWEVTGLFDLMEASFSHPESDISRTFAVFINQDREDLAYSFLNSCIDSDTNIDKFTKRFPLFMLHDRALIWEWVQRNADDSSQNFKVWMKKFLDIDKSRI